MEASPAVQAHDYANQAEACAAAGQLAAAVELHYLAAEQFLLAINDIKDIDAVRTLKILYATHTRQAKELQKRIEAARQAQNAVPASIPNAGTGIGGASGLGVTGSETGPHSGAAASAAAPSSRPDLASAATAASAASAASITPLKPSGSCHAGLVTTLSTRPDRSTPTPPSPAVAIDHPSAGAAPPSTATAHRSLGAVADGADGGVDALHPASMPPRRPVYGVVPRHAATPTGGPPPQRVSPPSAGAGDSVASPPPASGSSGLLAATLDVGTAATAPMTATATATAPPPAPHGFPIVRLPAMDPPGATVTQLLQHHFNPAVRTKPSATTLISQPSGRPGATGMSVATMSVAAMEMSQMQGSTASSDGFSPEAALDIFGDADIETGPASLAASTLARVETRGHGHGDDGGGGIIRPPAGALHPVSTGALSGASMVASLSPFSGTPDPSLSHMDKSYYMLNSTAYDSQYGPASADYTHAAGAGGPAASSTPGARAPRHGGRSDSSASADIDASHVDLLEAVDDDDDVDNAGDDDHDPFNKFWDVVEGLVQKMALPPAVSFSRAPATGPSLPGTMPSADAYERGDARHTTHPVDTSHVSGRASNESSTSSYGDGAGRSVYMLNSYFVIPDELGHGGHALMRPDGLPSGAGAGAPGGHGTLHEPGSASTESGSGSVFGTRSAAQWVEHNRWPLAPETMGPLKRSAYPVPTRTPSYGRLGMAYQASSAGGMSHSGGPASADRLPHPTDALPPPPPLHPPGPPPASAATPNTAYPSAVPSSTGWSMEALIQRNEHLQKLLDAQTAKVAMLERAGEENNMLRSSIIQFRHDVTRQAKRIAREHQIQQQQSSKSGLALSRMSASTAAGITLAGAHVGAGIDAGQGGSAGGAHGEISTAASSVASLPPVPQTLMIRLAPSGALPPASCPANTEFGDGPSSAPPSAAPSIPAPVPVPALVRAPVTTPALAPAPTSASASESDSDSAAESTAPVTAVTARCDVDSEIAAYQEQIEALQRRVAALEQQNAALVAALETQRPEGRSAPQDSRGSMNDID